MMINYFVCKKTLRQKKSCDHLPLKIEDQMGKNGKSGHACPLGAVIWHSKFIPNCVYTGDVPGMNQGLYYILFIMISYIASMCNYKDSSRSEIMMITTQG